MITIGLAVVAGIAYLASKSSEDPSAHSGLLIVAVVAAAVVVYRLLGLFRRAG